MANPMIIQKSINSAVPLICLGTIQGCYDSTTNNIKVDEKHSLVLLQNKQPPRTLMQTV